MLQNIVFFSMEINKLKKNKKIKYELTNKLFFSKEKKRGKKCLIKNM